MNQLLNKTKDVVADQINLPFSFYALSDEQVLLNVPVAKPMLLVVLTGQLSYGDDEQIQCRSGQFIFLADTPAIRMRSTPKKQEFFALQIEFEIAHFANIPSWGGHNETYVQGDVSQSLQSCLLQFVESTRWASEDIINGRKKEILVLLYQLGFTSLSSMISRSKLSDQIHQMILNYDFQDVTTADLCERLAISESTLRRNLKIEGTSLQQIKDRAKLGFGLHLLQTTVEPIGLIAEKCGYYSQSRFTDRFKNHFGMTPSELRKTKLIF